MRFRFRLDSVLRLRHQEVGLARQAVARALALLDEVMRREQEAERAWSAAIQEQLQQWQGGVTGAVWAAGQRHLHRLGRQTAAAGRQVEAARQELADTQRRLTELRQQEKALERLREQALDRFRSETARTEQRFLDDRQAVVAAATGPEEGFRWQPH